MTSKLESPLVRVERGELKPKVLTVYAELFTDSLGKSDGYWAEFYLLRCNRKGLYEVFDETSPETLLAHQTTTRQLVQHGLQNLASHDIPTIENALVIITVFFQSLFNKKFVNASFEIIALIAGLESIEGVFSRLLELLNQIIRKCPALHVKISAIRTTTIICGCSYQTSLAPYFLHRDMFASIMNFVNSPEATLYVGDGFTLIGILASYDKLQGHNPYQTRLSDFIDDRAISRVIQAAGHAWKISLAQYQQFEAATAPAMSFSSTIAYWIGWRTATTPSMDSAATPTDSASGSSAPAQQTKEMPDQTISITLAVYEFLSVNKVFARLLLETPGVPLGGSKSELPPMVHFISLCSYLFQNQHKSQRASDYSRLCLLILRLLIEETGPQSRLLVSQALKASQIQICRSRNPPLPAVNRDRVLAEGILDALLCSIRYNTKRSLDYSMYSLSLTIIIQLVSGLANNNKIALDYHWPQLWRTLTSLIRFFNSHTTDTPIAVATDCVELTVRALATCLVQSDSIFADVNHYYDLLYTIVESAGEIKKLQQTYKLDLADGPLSVLQSVINHYSPVLLKSDGKNMKSLSAVEVTNAIRDGNNDLNLYQITSGTAQKALVDGLPRFQESEERLFLKKITKQVINDVQYLYAYNRGA